MKWLRILCLAILLAALVASHAAAALTPGEIALVVNRTIPQSMELAQFYAVARGIPQNQIIQLDLPITDDVPFDQYERAVTPVVRQWLIDNGLRDKIRCLVTMFGVPLRIMDRGNSLPDAAELARLRETAKRVDPKIAELVADLEKQAAEFDKSFQPASTDSSLDWSIRRVERAGRSLAASMEQATDPQVRQRLGELVGRASARLTGPVDLGPPSPATIPTTNPTNTPIDQLIVRPFDRAARADLREQARRSGGIFGYAKTLQAQIDYFSTDATGAAFDSELALLWWPPYSRTRWQPNTLNPRYRDMRAAKTLMVMRIDAPTAQLVRDLVANTLAVERDGLQGKMVIDARGLDTKNPLDKDYSFALFDERLRKLAGIIESKTKVPLQLDNLAGVLPPNSADDVALYCGWYSVRKYVPGMKFNRGAVGYHVASFELLSLHNPLDEGWVRGLMLGGVVGTIGPVAEPYLHSFPLPEEFFPLLLSGKLTFAEVYWTCSPLTSWMQTCIGDPLYKPYAKNPQIKLEDLPPVFRAGLE